MVNNLETAFNELFIEMFPKLTTTAYLKVRNHETAEDLAQDTLLVVYNNLEKVLAMENYKQWIYKVLQNKIKHEFRAKARFISMVSKLEREFQAAAPVDDKGWEEILEGLSRDNYELLYLIYVDGYNNLEVAEKLNISHDACRKRVQRAKEELRRKEK